MSNQKPKPTYNAKFTKGVGNSYIFKNDENGVLQKIDRLTGNIIARYDEPPDEHIDWDKFAFNIASAYDNKVNKLLALPIEEWKSTPKLHGKKWWNPKRWVAWLFRKKEINRLKDKMRADKLRFAEIDRLMQVAFN